MTMHKPEKYEYECANLIGKKYSNDCDKYSSCADCPYWQNGYETHCKMVWVIQNINQIVDCINQMCRGWSEQVEKPIDLATIISNSVEKHGLGLRECEIDLIAEDLIEKLTEEDNDNER